MPYSACSVIAYVPTWGCPVDEWDAYDNEPYENPDDYMDEADE